MKAEQAYLGTMLKENHLINDTILTPEHFVDGRHKRLFSVMRELCAAGQSVDLITLTVKGDIREVGGASYINELLTYANAEKSDEYENLILENWKEREKLNILERAKSENWPIDKVAKSLDDINQSKANDHTSIQDALAKIYEAPWEDRPIKKGVPSGIQRLDFMTGGFQDKEVTIIAARPSMGKTDVMLHIGKQSGWQGYLPIIFSLEMPAERLTERLIASTGGYNRAKLRDPYRMLSAPQKETWVTTVGRLSDTDIQIFDEAGQSIPEMRAKVRKLISAEEKKPVVIIDYLTLIRPKEKYNGNAHQQVTEISKDLKAMAKEFACPIICLAQLSRAVEQRQDKRPMMSDIRESGSVEQDADVIVFLYRDKYYNKTDSNDMEWIVAKNRNGPVGTVVVDYNEFTGEIRDKH